MEPKDIKIEEGVEIVETPISEAPAEVVAEEVALPVEVVPARGFKKNPRRSSPRREPRAKSEFDQKIIGIRRVTRVVTGGRRFSFSVGMVIGDRKGRVGVGLGKASDTPLAIDKAIRDARKNMIKVNMTKKNSIPHSVDTKYKSSRVLIMPAPGKGILAGSSVRTVFELAGLNEVSAKIFSRSKNALNNAKVAIKALLQLKNRRVEK